MPRLTRLTAREVRIPLRRTVRHASHARRENRSLLVEAELDDGTVGHGEGLPRAYVTGESIDSVFATLADADLPRQFGGPWDDLPAAVALCDAFTPPRPPGRDAAGNTPRDSFGNTARCAVELAVLDAACRAAGRPLSDVTALAAPGLFRPRDAVRYGVVLTGVSPAKQRALSLAYRLYGFRDLKVKVGAGADDAALHCPGCGGGRGRGWTCGRTPTRRGPPTTSKPASPRSAGSACPRSSSPCPTPRSAGSPHCGRGWACR